jgi:hypothetical protein
MVLPFVGLCTLCWERGYRLTADLTAVSSGFIARLNFGELARWGRFFYQSKLALTLLVLGVLADDANDTLAVNDLALVADRLY